MESSWSDLESSIAPGDPDMIEPDADPPDADVEDADLFLGLENDDGYGSDEDEEF
jgi:hypothetical protein